MGLFTYVGRLVAGVGSRIIALAPYGNPVGSADNKSLQSRTSQSSPSSGDFNPNGASGTVVTSSSQFAESDRAIPAQNSEAFKKIFSGTLEEPSLSTLASISGNILLSISEVVISQGEDKVLTEVAYEPQTSEPIFNKSSTPIAVSMSNLPGNSTNLTEEQKSNSQLFALIIGINKYQFDTRLKSQDISIPSNRAQTIYSPKPSELPSFTNLRGAVPDAERFYKYLLSDLGVPSEQITLLLDEQATRAEIIQAFQFLSERPNIHKGDSIVIFYAGHGAQALPPRRLSGKPGCPTYIELLVPYDYGKDPKNHESMGIPDYTLAALLNKIAEKKGNNITVIFDCCHSASALRGPVSKPASNDVDSLNQPMARAGPELPYHVPDDLDEAIWGGMRALSALPRLRHLGSASYVFFAACASTELAKENNGRGYFTSALLSLLQEVGSRALTCSEIISCLGKISDQSPQCEGVHTKDRTIFHGFSPSYGKRFFNISRDTLPPGTLQYTVDAGSLHGLSAGDELTAYKTQSEDDQKKPVAVFLVVEASNRKSLLKYRDQPFPFDLSLLANPTPALLTKPAQPHLRLHISAKKSSHVEQLVSLIMNRLQMNGIIDITTSKHERTAAHISLSTDDGVNLRFHVVDKDLTEDHYHEFIYEGDNANERFSRILRGLSNYYWHLERARPLASMPVASMPLDSEISVSLNKLREDNADALENYNPLFSEEGEAIELHNDGVISLEVDLDTEANAQGQDEFGDPGTDDSNARLYGLKVTNRSQKWNLYPALFYFDNTNFTIAPIYQHPLGNQNAESPLKKGESITIGYGAEGAGVAVPPLYFSLPKGRKMDIGFLKLILSTEPINLDMIQKSPFFEDAARGLGKLPTRKKPSPSNWSSITVKVIQRLREGGNVED